LQEGEREREREQSEVVLVCWTSQRKSKIRFELLRFLLNGGTMNVFHRNLMASSYDPKGFHRKENSID
jgi:hypothetical protein